ncbi:MAG: short chain dehydrogenase [Gammaproteobacteria bacterium]|nr:MAG: short chain dehydrogenase [Gammaproteobacteria bacterium]
MKLSGKTALLTGATGGTGSAIARALAKEDVRLILIGRNSEKLAQLRQQLGGSEHLTLATDLTRAEGRRALREMAAEYGIDLLINNAGVNQLALLEQVSDAELATMIETNLAVPMRLCRDLLPLLEARSESAIVNVGSILGSIGYAGSVSYCATKFGLRGFSEALRRELADRSVQVVYFAPRATTTPFNSDKMVAMNEALGTTVDSAEEVAASLLDTLRQQKPHNRYLGWPEKFFVRVNGLLPKLVDKALYKQLSIIRRFAE